MTKYFIMRDCENILSGYLFVVTTVFGEQDGTSIFKFPEILLETLAETSSLVTLLLNQSILKAQLLELMFFSFAFTWLNAIQAGSHPHTTWI